MKKESILVRWALKNPVTINLVMMIVMVLGFMSAGNLRREAFPETPRSQISVYISLLKSSSPDQVDRNIVQVIYPAIRGVRGIKEITSFASANYANFTIEVEEGSDIETIRREVNEDIEGIYNLPEDAERPSVKIIKSYEHPIWITVAGATASSAELTLAAEAFKTQLLNNGIISKGFIVPYPYPELTIYVPKDILIAKGLSLSSLAQQIKSYDLEIGLGRIKGKDGKWLIKGSSRKKSLNDLGTIPIHFPNGETLPLVEVVGYDNLHEGSVKDEEPIFLANGKTAVIIGIERGEKEDTITLCNEVREAIKTFKMPAGIHLDTLGDFSTYIQDRLDLVIKNGVMGLILVLIILSLFLEWRIAFWAASGIAFSLIGSFAIMDLCGSTINMISLFAFLITLGIIVDDAIVIGEAFHYRFKKEGNAKDAIVHAVADIKWPVIAMMTTTAITFVPLFFLSGQIGRMMAVMPVVVIAALGLSLFESIVILPVHLAHHCADKKTFFMRALYFCFYPLIRGSMILQPKVNHLLDTFSECILKPILAFCIHHRYSVIIFCIAIASILGALIPGGIVKRALFPDPAQDWENVFLELKERSTIPELHDATKLVLKALEEANEHFEKIDGVKPIKSYFADIGDRYSYKSHVFVNFIRETEGRDVSAQKFSDYWRTQIPEIKDLVALKFQSEGSNTHSKPVEVTLTSSSDALLEKGEALIKKAIARIKGAVDIETSTRSQSTEIEVSLKDAYKHLSFSESDLAYFINSTYQGSKVDTFFQNERAVEVYVRSPREERQDLYRLGELQTPSGLYVGQIANLTERQAASEIIRNNGRRSITIGANVNSLSNVTAAEIRDELESGALQTLSTRLPGLDWEFTGEAKEGAKAINSILMTYIPALLAIYLILATVFRSYLQPLLIMTAIPFGFAGAIFGHWVMDIPFNLLSALGMAALTGIAVNDSLVLIDCINKTLKDETFSFTEALICATRRRLRPILLTTLTTLIGMAPVLFESSYQAQYLIPMITSLVFGLGLSTILIIFLVPAGFAVIADLFRLIHKLSYGKWVDSKYFFIKKT